MSGPTTKIARAGYDARTASDSELLYSSQWPALLEAHTDDSIYTAGANNQGFIPHELGYPPLSFAWISPPYPVSGDGQLLSSGWTVFYPDADSNSLYIPQAITGNLTNGQSYTIHWIATNVDISVSAAYPPLNMSQGIPSGYDPKKGVKIVRGKKKITSTDMRDFILNSRCQAPQLQQVIVSTQTISIPVPAYFQFMFAYSTVDGILWQNGNNTASLLDIQGGTIVLTPVAVQQQSLTILRDPLFAATTIQVVH